MEGGQGEGRRDRPTQAHFCRGDGRAESISKYPASKTFSRHRYQQNLADSVDDYPNMEKNNDNENYGKRGEGKR